MVFATILPCWWFPQNGIFVERIGTSAAFEDFRNNRLHPESGDEPEHIDDDLSGDPDFRGAVVRVPGVGAVLVRPRPLSQVNPERSKKGAQQRNEVQDEQDHRSAKAGEKVGTGSSNPGTARPQHAREYSDGTVSLQEDVVNYLSP